jgi:hypothetical protein
MPSSRVGCSPYSVAKVLIITCQNSTSPPAALSSNGRVFLMYPPLSRSSRSTKGKPAPGSTLQTHGTTFTLIRSTRTLPATISSQLAMLVPYTRLMAQPER